MTSPVPVTPTMVVLSSKIDKPINHGDSVIYEIIPVSISYVSKNMKHGFGYIDRYTDKGLG